MKRRGLIQFLIVLGLLLGLVVGCAVLLTRTGGDEVVEGERTELTTMTFRQFESVTLGTTQAQIEEKFGTAVPRQQVINAGVIADSPETRNCIYYKADPPTFGEWFEFCFAGKQLTNKTSL